MALPLPIAKKDIQTVLRKKGQLYNSNVLFWADVRVTLRILIQGHELRRDMNSKHHKDDMKDKLFIQGIQVVITIIIINICLWEVRWES